MEEGETPLEAAARELKEETGAIDYTLKEVCDYSVNRGEEKSFGRLFFSEIESYSATLEHEIAEVKSFKGLPENLTWPAIQPHLFEGVIKRLGL